MQQQIEMEVAVREERGKNAARRLRLTGNVPATVYGLGKAPRAISVNTKAMTSVLKEPSGHNRVFNITCDGVQEHAMAVDYQIDPVKHSLLHVDLLRVDVNKPVTVSVPIKAVGTAFGVKTEGGFEEMVSREVRIECLPLDIPESLDVDVTDLHVGEAIRAKDLPASDKWTLADFEQKVLVHIMASRATGELEEEEAEEEETEAEEQAE
ncbi:MAG: 50S ribosomal protein L25 [Bryobacterales bacterium]|nr:50S ribosomal protein L25 [Bryobacterales bacterium]MDE0265001.1 50S ribosomal protein L25 [Bryobacterales bacterium]